MIRRDEVIKLLGKYNSSSVIEEDVIGLEKYIDDSLINILNIKKWINNSNIGATTSGSLENVNIPNITNDVHKDITVVGNDKITITKNNIGVGYTLWDDELKTANGIDATKEPWNDRTIAEGAFNGVLTIQCPTDTNKNAAFMLAQKYMAIDKKDTNGNVISGYWSNAVKPNDKDNNNTTEDVLNDAVTVTYDSENNIVYMNFKLF